GIARAIGGLHIDALGPFHWTAAAPRTRRTALAGKELRPHRMGRIMDIHRRDRAGLDGLLRRAAAAAPRSGIDHAIDQVEAPIAAERRNELFRRQLLGAIAKRRA